MAKKNSRRTVSLSAETYVRLVRYSARVNIPMARILESELNRFFESEQEPSVSHDEAAAVLKARFPQKDPVVASGIWTF